MVEYSVLLILVITISFWLGYLVRHLAQGRKNIAGKLQIIKQDGDQYMQLILNDDPDVSLRHDEATFKIVRTQK